MSAAVESAENIAARLGSIEGVAAVALGGSWARGEAYPDSDVDLGIYYDPDSAPSVNSLRELARELDDRHAPGLVTGFGEWGPWINGGGWLRIGGRRMDWLYRDLDRVAKTLADCLAGRPTCDYQPGHPHGFHNHIYAGEIYHCRPLHDPAGKLHELKTLVDDYPKELKRALIDKFLWEADFALDTARASAARGDVFYVSGCLFRCAACLVQVLYALNERYFVNEKGSVGAASSFARSPAGFGEAISGVLARPGGDPEQLKRSIGRFEVLGSAVRAMCAETA